MDCILKTELQMIKKIYFYYFYSSGFESILAFLTLCYITVHNESKKCFHIIHEVSIPSSSEQRIDKNFPPT